MKKIEVDHLKIGEDRFPVYCDLNALDQLQEKYGSITEFERKLMGWEIVRDEDGEPERDDEGNIKKKNTEPSARVILDTLLIMIEEGQKIEERYGAEEDSYTDKVTMEDLETMPLDGANLYTLSNALHVVFMKTFIQKKSNEIKEEQPKKKKTSSSISTGSTS